ncbi:AlwI family type II restriction endonuclease [Halalkalibacter alkaliphilus]|uniref:AlwI family type II restriction endonuclease n=1 Tax=Halalkalibacter alkaliphilus TaxID=2917993 RepID=A0A9X2CVU0_9BACI|nr:AlwI family type II restriction endonuclease [Halalkalibacter alkaliphilus]MCL7748769.1 AlwI family type II restriction endonuclease [Halalkalibacter alkaliphilus]
MIINSTHYTWVIGNTGFRESALYQKIEGYILLLEEFTKRGYQWDKNQTEFFELMNEAGFMEDASTNATNIPKASRLKTSPLQKLGLVNESREITEVGNVILRRSKERLKVENKLYFDDEHFLENDGDIYIKQLLKLQFSATKDKGIKPFILFLELLKEFGSLSRTEITFILPLIITEELKEEGKRAIEEFRNKKEQQECSKEDIEIWIQDYIIKQKYNLRKYVEVKAYIEEKAEEVLSHLKEENDKDILDFILPVDMNGKSADYSKPLVPLLTGIYNIWLNIKNKEDTWDSIRETLDAIEKTTGTQEKRWRDSLFGIKNKGVLKSKDIEGLNNTLLNEFKNRVYTEDFKDLLIKFYDILTYIKWYNNLLDYADHNLRYLKLSNILEETSLFEEKAIRISDFYKVLVDKILDDSEIKKYHTSTDDYFDFLYNTNYQLPKFEDDDFIKISDEVVKRIQEISKDDVELPAKTENPKQYVSSLKDKYNETRIKNMKDNLRKSIINEDNGNLLECLYLLEKRSKSKDNKLKGYMDTEADVPTIFEYLLWQAFLLLDGYVGNAIDFANFDLDIDLKPIQHAGGGMADIIFKYADHHLILEATLTNDENQRRAEMEPIPRHLAKYRHEVDDKTNCLFVAPYIDPNVAVVHRMFKFNPYYVKDNNNYVGIENSEIIPLGISELKNLIKFAVANNKNYHYLKENVIDILNSSEERDGYLWYKDEVVQTINNIKEKVETAS